MTRASRRAAATVALVVGAAGPIAGPLSAQGGPPSTGRPLAAGHSIDLGPLPEAVKESSGLAVSRVHPGIFWTHNDSGDGPLLYALDGAARLTGTHRVRGAGARDWEDVGLGPCPGDGSASCLFVADTGDNGRRRDSVRVYVVREPEPGGDDDAELVGRIELTYDVGPLDVEGLAVRGDGTLALVSKGRDGAVHTYTVTPSQVEAGLAGSRGGRGTPGRTPLVGPLVLTGGVELPIVPDFAAGRWVTGAAFAPDGTVLAVRTYTELYFFSWPLGDRPRMAAPTCSLASWEPGGEAVDVSPDGRLYVTSESPGTLVGHLREVGCAGFGGTGRSAPARR